MRLAAPRVFGFERERLEKQGARRSLHEIALPYYGYLQ